MQTNNASEGETGDEGPRGRNRIRGRRWGRANFNVIHTVDQSLDLFGRDLKVRGTGLNQQLI